MHARTGHGVLVLLHGAQTQVHLLAVLQADALALLADIVLALEEPKKPKVKPDLAYNNVTLRPHG